MPKQDMVKVGNGPSSFALNTNEHYGEDVLLDQTSIQIRQPAEFKHITKRRKRN